MKLIVFTCLIAFVAAKPGFAPGAYSAQQVGYASPLSYSAPLSYSNVYNAPLAYSRYNGGFAGSSLAAAPLAANPLAYSSPLAYNGLGGYGSQLASSPLAYSAYNNPYLGGNGLVRSLNNYNYLY